MKAPNISHYFCWLPALKSSVLPNRALREIEHPSGQETEALDRRRAEVRTVYGRVAEDPEREIPLQPRQSVR